MHRKLGSREGAACQEAFSSSSRRQIRGAKLTNQSFTRITPIDEAFITYPGPSRRHETSFISTRIDRQRPNIVVIEDDKEFREELASTVGLCGFTVWWFNNFDANILGSRLVIYSRTIDVVHCDLHMQHNGSERFITTNEVLNLKKRLGGPRFGIASIYADEKVDEFEPFLPSKEPWEVDYFLGKPSEREDLYIHLTAILEAARLRELGRLVDNGRVLDASRSLDKDAEAGMNMALARLPKYLLPFDVSIEQDALEKYKSLLDRLTLIHKGRARAGLVKEAYLFAKDLILYEKCQLTTLYDIAKRSIKSASEPTSLRPHEFEIAISMPKYVERMSEFEVLISFPVIKQWAEEESRKELNLVIVASSDNFQIRDGIRSTGWPSRNRAKYLTIKAIPLRLGMCGIVFEFFLGATVVASAVCRTLVTTRRLTGSSNE